MAGTSRMSIEQWTSVKANSLLAMCLLAGIGGGWIFRGSQNAAIIAGSAASANVTASTKMDASKGSLPLSPVRMKEVVDAQVAPLVDKLKSDPNNPDLLTNIGNLYYDAQQYSVAIDYYGRALKSKPADAAIRTDMATAYWYTGDADRAIAEFNKALTYEPNKSNTLFNLGLVKLKGKKDKAGALADWEKLLATNHNYEGKDNVERMMAEAK